VSCDSLILLLSLYRLIDLWNKNRKRDLIATGFRYSLICQGTSTRRQRRDLFGLRLGEQSGVQYSGSINSKTHVAAVKEHKCF